jgi:N4-gp56 family major capsid protein
MAMTKLADLINPEVMADMISAKIENAIVVTPFAKIDTTLAGQPGSKITVPQYNYIGDAVDVPEGEEVPESQLSVTDVEYEIKKAAKGVTLTDEAVLSAYGNPVGETNSQLALAIRGKVEGDCISALATSENVYEGADVIGYEGIVKAIDVFNEEMNTEKVMFVNPKQVSTLRLDNNFISADKYNAQVIMKGEIGMVANTRIVPSRRIVEQEGFYYCPIVQLETDERTEDDVPAITIYTKRETNVETERDTHTKTTFISADKHYVAALTNASKVVVAKFSAVKGA